MLSKKNFSADLTFHPLKKQVFGAGILGIKVTFP